MSAGSTLLGVGLGLMMGIPAAYIGGRVDAVLMRIVDVILAFPQLVFAILVVSVVGPKVWLLILVVALGHAPQVARVIRASALDVAESDFVRAVELLHVSRSRVMAGEILPNITSIVMVELGLRMTWSIVLIAGLSFIGFGLQPPAANWGLMIYENQEGLITNAFSVLIPAALIAMLAVGVNLFTDAVARISLGVDRNATTIGEMVNTRVEAAA
jgi:peptide/nickel transport system permease protein